MAKSESFDPAVVKVCKAYSSAIAKSEKADGAAGLSHWRRAEAAFSIMETCEALKVPYIAPATKLCEVERSTIVMEVKAETMRRELKFTAEKLPPDSLSAFYELHRAKEAAFLIAGSGKAEIAAADKKIAAVGKQIAKGLSVREVRKAFKNEFAQAQKERRMKGKLSQRPVPEVVPAAPIVMQVNADELKDVVEKVVIPAGLAVPLIRIRPTDTTAQAIEAYLAVEKFRRAIADECHSTKTIWVMIDLRPEKLVPEKGIDLLKTKAVTAA